MPAMPMPSNRLFSMVTFLRVVTRMPRVGVSLKTLSWMLTSGVYVMFSTTWLLTATAEGMALSSVRTMSVRLPDPAPMSPPWPSGPSTAVTERTESETGSMSPLVMNSTWSPTKNDGNPAVSLCM